MTTKPQILPLTGLRFFAALIVVVHHFATPDNVWLANFKLHSFLGVTLFFVLSGFILSYTYVERPGQMKGSHRDFWAARIARIYPVYFVGLLLFAPFMLRGDEALSLKLSVGAASILLVQSWVNAFQPGLFWNMWNPPGWSLSAEALFYLSFPFFCVRLSKLRMRGLLLAIGVCWIASIAATIVYVLTGSASRGIWMFNPVLRLPEFVMGVTLGIAWKRRATDALDRIAPYAGPAAVVALTASLFLPLSDEWYFNGMSAPLVAVIVCSLACNRGWLARFLSMRLVVVLGSASFSLYILHWPLWRTWQFLIAKSIVQLPAPEMSFPIYLGLSIIASYICFRLIEEPANKLLRAALMRPQQHRPVVAEQSLPADLLADPLVEPEGRGMA